MRLLKLLVLLSTVYCLLSTVVYAQQPVKEPITVNGDNVEYSADNREVTASGNVSILYKGTKLTCKKITINTETKDAEAEGDVRLEDGEGIIEGERIKYNFQNKTGTIIDAQFRSNPYFGKAKSLDKVSENEFIASEGYISTCSYDHPHYRIKAKKIDYFPGDKVHIDNIKAEVGQYKQIPIMYLPLFNQSLKDKIWKIQAMPGKKKDWGYYLLTAWRYDLTESVKGRIYLDYREKLGVGEGFDTNYVSRLFGDGDFKYYYTQERVRGLPEGSPAEFQRYLVRWRHRWDIDESTNLVTQFFKMVDSKRAVLGDTYNFLKDYYPREYDLDSYPLTFAQFHKSFVYSSLDIISQKRINRWYTQLEKLPEAQYSMPSLQIGSTPLYFENSSSVANFSYKHAVPSPSSDDIKDTRVDTRNKISMPMKVAFINFTPYVANEETFYNQDIYGSSVHPRTIFYTGAELSTKFYKILEFKTNFLGLDIKRLRHIITPTVGYSYNHKPTVSSARLKQIDAIDSIDTSNRISFGLSNKLQTKRVGGSVDLVDFRIDTSYRVYSTTPVTGVKNHSLFEDINLNLDIKPYSWMTIHSDASFDKKQYYFTDVNADLNFSVGKERNFSLGQRYERKGSKEMTFSSEWRLSPKWKFQIYERYQFANLSSAIPKGLREQQYILSRDLHCWTMEFSYNVERGRGENIWLVFRLKAFPELEFNFNKSYHAPKSGSQGYLN
ncbi:MAG: LPS assembly protein LptD [Candidatus Omnitrophota bacterium]